jgi:hypothetical protein
MVQQRKGPVRSNAGGQLGSETVLRIEVWTEAHRRTAILLDAGCRRLGRPLHDGPHTHHPAP